MCDLGVISLTINSFWIPLSSRRHRVSHTGLIEDFGCSKSFQVLNLFSSGLYNLWIDIKAWVIRYRVGTAIKNDFEYVFECAHIHSTASYTSDVTRVCAPHATVALHWIYMLRQHSTEVNILRCSHDSQLQCRVNFKKPPVQKP